MKLTLTEEEKEEIRQFVIKNYYDIVQPKSKVTEVYIYDIYPYDDFDQRRGYGMRITVTLKGKVIHQFVVRAIWFDIARHLLPENLDIGENLKKKFLQMNMPE